MDVSNAVAAELAGMGDGVLDALRDRLGCTIRLRGNQLTLEGDDGKVEEAREVIDELVELVEGGHQIGAQTVDAVLGALETDHDVRDVFDDVVWRHRGKRIAPKTVTQKAYVDAIRQRTITFGIGPAGTGKTYLAMALAVAALQERQVARIILTRPAVEAGERLGFLPGDMLAKVDPYLRPLFDALYDMLEPERANTYMERGTIEVAPLALHARPDAQRQLHHPRRGPEHLAGADADVPDPARLRLEGRRHRRRHPDRPAARPALGADPGAAASSTGSTTSPSCSSTTGTSSATSWCSGSSRPTASTRRRRAPSGASSAMLTVEVDNRSGIEVDEGAAVELACRVLRDEGIDDGELGLAFVGPDEMRELKREHLGIDEATDVLSFPIDGRDDLPDGLPRALGDVVLCPVVVGDAWRAPLTHGLLHLLGYDHGEEMERREGELA